MMAGKNYEFQLTLTNPLYDPIEVKLSVSRIHVSTESPAVEKGEKEDPRDRGKAKAPTRSPFAVSLPTQKFTISSFAEAWEYDDDEDMFGVEDDELGIGGHTATVPTSSSSKAARDKDGRTRPMPVGVLERKSNKTVVGGEVMIGKEARGHIKVRRNSL
jgi:dynactin-4